MTSGPRLPHAFGRYVLRARVAAGGMAEVFHATLPGFGGFEKDVAIKRMYRQYSDDATFVEMLTDEAKIVSQLHHPNIVQILDVGRVNDDYYIAFEYVDGVDLFRLLQKQFELGRDLPLAMALHIVAELCSALDYAHARRTHSGEALSIVHRDVSPQNLLVGHQGEVKLTDFGIAKAAYRFTQTQAGMIKGKLYYMSPEQARGEPIDHRSDLFAAGILLYELLCTRPLYGDGKPKELLAKVGRGEYTWPADKKARVPMALLAVVDKALQRNANQRYQTGREFREALLRVADQLGLRTDREALGAYLRKIYAVTENRPPAMPAQPRGQALDEQSDGEHWSTSIAEMPRSPAVVEQPTTRRPERAGPPRGASLPRATRRPATAGSPIAPAPAAAPPKVPAPTAADGVPPPLPTTAARSPNEPPADDATAMLDMNDLAARLANAPAPKPLHRGATQEPTVAPAPQPPAPRAARPQRKSATHAAAVPRPPKGKAQKPHLLRTGQQRAAPSNARARPSSVRLRAASSPVAGAARAASSAVPVASAQPVTARPPAASARSPHARAMSDGVGDKRAARRASRPRQALSPIEQSNPTEASTRFVQAMPDDDAAIPAPEASTRFVQAMPDELGADASTAPRPSSLPRASASRGRHPRASGVRPAAVRAAMESRPVAAPAHAAHAFAHSMDAAPADTGDPNLAPASWGLIGLTATVWAGVVVLGVYSMLLLVR